MAVHLELITIQFGSLWSRCW